MLFQLIACDLMNIQFYSLCHKCPRDNKKQQKNSVLISLLFILVKKKCSLVRNIAACKLTDVAKS